MIFSKHLFKNAEESDTISTMFGVYGDNLNDKQNNSQ